MGLWIVELVAMVVDGIHMDAVLNTDTEEVILRYLDAKGRGESWTIDAGLGAGQYGNAALQMTGCCQFQGGVQAAYKAVMNQRKLL